MGLAKLEDGAARAGLRAVPDRQARLLLCDDNRDLRRLYTLLLERAGYAVTAAADGEEAFHRFLDAPPDLLLTDWHMPRLNGLDLILALRCLGYRQPVILISGGSTCLHGHLEDIAVLRKPADTLTVLRLVEAFLGHAAGSGAGPKERGLTNVRRLRES